MFDFSCVMYIAVKNKMTFPTAKQRTKLTSDIFKQCLSSTRISIDIQVLQNYFKVACCLEVRVFILKVVNWFSYSEI